LRKLLPDGFTALLAAAAILPALSLSPPLVATLKPAVPVTDPIFMVLLFCASAGPVSASVASSPNAISLIVVVLFGFDNDISGIPPACFPAHADAQITDFPWILSKH
jgi:hypothetical protein